MILEDKAITAALWLSQSVPVSIGPQGFEFNSWLPQPPEQSEALPCLLLVLASCLSSAGEAKDSERQGLVTESQASRGQNKTLPHLPSQLTERGYCSITLIS